MHAVRGDVAGAHRLERAGADVQGEEGELDAACAQALEERRVEVEPCGRRRDRARGARIDGLVTRLVLGGRRVRDVGRERHLAVALEHVEHLAVEAEPEEVALARDDRGVDRAGEAQASPRLRRVARPDLRERLAGIERALDEHLDLAARILDAVEPRLHDPRVVEHEHVAGREELGRSANA